ncbi:MULTISPECIES: ABC transporter permease [Rhizobium]|uniref:Spermidine/putrescine ABC transporter permease n=1 Tax=Rhizobium wuzhouense TaxID=1986026 RepID=A0ABX5NK48_9HYPH|nr:MULTISPECIES: ABC transporter permease [Rhizobium]PYB69859.1 spermidine/putrescine ABC transporter permease [Rhizobium wuzhouense]RKE77437.1 putative spermidine/putrescine transport system permease protein [Rhizobium sp. AG855]
MSQVLLRRVFFSVLAIVMAAPFIVVLGVSVNAKKSLTFPPQGFNLGWYLDLFRTPDWSAALFNSSLIALLSAAFAVMIAFPLAWFNWRYRMGIVKVIIAVGLMPFLLPPVITAMGFLSFWTQSGFYGQSWTVVISHGIFLVSLPLVSLTLGFSSLEASLPEAAATMGADNRTILTTIVLPLVRPYLISGFAFAFVVSLNEYLVAYMTVGAVIETLPMKIFNSLRYGYTPVMASASVFFVFVTVVIFSLVARFSDLPKLLGAHSK